MMSVFYEKDIYLKREKMKKFRPEKEGEKNGLNGEFKNLKTNTVFKILKRINQYFKILKGYS